MTKYVAIYEMNEDGNWDVVIPDFEACRLVCTTIEAGRKGIELLLFQSVPPNHAFTLEHRVL